jgi:SAM-dependent methyltransferase
MRILVRRFLHSCVESGPRGLWASIWRRLRGGGAGKGDAGGAHGSELGVGDRAVRCETHPFDVEHGTETSGIIYGENLNTGSRSDLWNTAYHGISPSGFKQIMEALGAELGSEWERFTFVDLGSGKGRALLLASRFPFRKIVGVEISAELSAAAAENVRVFAAPWQMCREIETICGDAATFDYPCGPMVLYLYNPFLPPVLKRCLRNLARKLEVEPREVYVVYVHPLFKREMERVQGLKKVWERSFALSEEDGRADLVGTKWEDVVLWRYLPPR